MLAGEPSRDRGAGKKAPPHPRCRVCQCLVDEEAWCMFCRCFLCDACDVAPQRGPHDFDDHFSPGSFLA